MEEREKMGVRVWRNPSNRAEYPLIGWNEWTFGNIFFSKYEKENDSVSEKQGKP